MTPLELLTVGVIVVGVWAAGWLARERDDSDDPGVAWLPCFLGVGMVFSAFAWLLTLGIKEAAK